MNDWKKSSTGAAASGVPASNIAANVRVITIAFLALVLDLCSRRVVGWSLADHMTEPLVLDALQHAISDRQPPSELIHHSDRGGQYAGHEYRADLGRS